MATTVVLASGGINSTVTALRAGSSDQPSLLFVNYGQRAATAQRQALGNLAKALSLPLSTLKLPHVVEIAALKRSTGSAGSAAGSADEGATAVADRVSRIPGLMMVMLGAAAQFAIRIGASSVQVGSSEAADEQETESAPGKGSADHRRDFFYLMRVTYEQALPRKAPLALETPLIDLTRDEIIKLGMRYETPFDLTYSCDAGRQPPCGGCPGCVARSKAFATANLLDPLMEAPT